MDIKNHKIFKKYKDALSYANDLIDGIKGEVLFDDAWDDYLVNGENTGDCKLYKNGKFIKTINTDDNYKWSNLIMLYKKDDGFMVYTDFEFDESKKSVKKSLKESFDKFTVNTLRGELMKLGYWIDDLLDLPSKRHANEVIRQAETVINFCESTIYELKNAIKNNEV